MNAIETKARNSTFSGDFSSGAGNNVSGSVSPTKLEYKEHSEAGAGPINANTFNGVSNGRQIHHQPTGNIAIGASSSNPTAS
jgi:hypothetical protein